MRRVFHIFRAINDHIAVERVLERSHIVADQDQMIYLCIDHRRGETRTATEQESRLGTTAYTWEPHHRLPHWQRSGYGTQLRHFARAILAGTQPYPSLHDGWRNLVVARAILESCETRQTVHVPQDDM